MLHQTTFLTIYILTITFILGCALGSFTDCLAGRMLAGASILKGRSHCDACGHVLGVPDLVPLFSWLCLRGRCRYCGAKIPAESFWAELVSGIACCLIVYRFDVSVLALRGILLWIVLLCLTLTDPNARYVTASLEETVKKDGEERVLASLKQVGVSMAVFFNEPEEGKEE